MFLEPILSQFHKNLDRYVSVQQRADFPHFYNERATLGFLAAAFWQQEWIALEEYATEKRVGEASYPGRADLWVRGGSENPDIVIEAKQRWPRLTEKDSTVRVWLDVTADDATRNEDAEMRAAVTFLAPSLPPDTPRSAIDEHFKRLYELALDHGADALALWLPDDGQKFEGCLRTNDEPRIWPGLLTVLQVV
jgi:hypothetical protein